MVLIATICGIVSYSLLILRWRGNTNWLESMYITPGYVASRPLPTVERVLTGFDSGMGAGITQTAAFTALQASINPADKVPAISALYLIIPMGTTIGLAIASALMTFGLRKGLLARLVALGLSSSDIQQVSRRPQGSGGTASQSGQLLTQRRLSKGLAKMSTTSIGCLRVSPKLSWSRTSRASNTAIVS